MASYIGRRKFLAALSAAAAWPLAAFPGHFPRRTYETNPPTNSRPIDPVFRADSVVPAIRPRKTRICGWSTPGSDAAKVVLLGEVLKMRWRGPTPPLRVTSGSTGGLYVFEPPAGGHRYTSRGAGRKVPWVAASKRTHLRAEGWPRRGRLITVRLKRGRALVIRRTARRKYWIRTAASVRLDVGRWEP